MMRGTDKGTQHRPQSDPKWSQNRPKMEPEMEPKPGWHVWRSWGVSGQRFGGVLVSPGAVLGGVSGGPGAVLGRPGASLGPSWRLLGASWAVLVLGASWRGASWRRHGEGFWRAFGSSSVKTVFDVFPEQKQFSKRVLIRFWPFQRSKWPWDPKRTTKNRFQIGF